MRILFVGFPESIHTVRWINQLADQGWDLHLFPSRRGELHSEFRNLTTYGFSAPRPQDLGTNVKWQPLWPRRGMGRLGMVMHRFNPGRYERSVWLAKLICRLKPDIVHSLEFQNAAYLTLAAREHFAGKDFPVWAVSNWGSDIYLYRRLPEHLEKIEAILSHCDYYFCECRRDVELARSLGLKGEALSVLPNTGGFDVEQARRLRAPGKTSSRRLIVLKGYHNWAGRALVALRAIELCADVLKGYEIVIHAAPDVELAARLLTESTGVPISLMPPSSHEEMLRLHGRARVSIGLSISDGISTSALEAMVMGSFPIQSNTSCFGEWAKAGESTFLVHPEDPADVAIALRRAVTDDELVDRAAEMNAEISLARLDRSKIEPQVIESYQKIQRSGHSRKGKSFASHFRRN